MLKTISSFLSTCFFFAVIAFILIITSVWQISQELPEYRQLERYEPAVTTRLYAGNGEVMMEYAAEKRLFVPEDKIPALVKQAFISAEDKNFYSHFGVDLFGITRAVLMNLKNFGSGRRPTGASTITQQVAKNFLLSSELSYKSPARLPAGGWVIWPCASCGPIMRRLWRNTEEFWIRKAEF